MNRILAGAILIAALAVRPVLADPTTDDVHCLIAQIVLAGSPDQSTRAVGLMGQLYWLGKLDGRNPQLDMEGQILAELPKMTGDYLRAETVRCGDELKRRGEAESAMGKDIQQKAQPQPQSPP